jgi:hypothetical protein
MDFGDLPKDCLIYLCGNFLEHTDIVNLAATGRKFVFSL